MRKVIFTALVLVLSFTGCKKEGGGGTTGGTSGSGQAVPSKSGGDSMFAGFDPQAEIKALQGTWQIRDGLSEKTTWVITDTKVTRKKGDKSDDWTLSVPYPGRLAVTKSVAGGGTESEYYGYARNGNELYVGLGKAGAKVGDRFLVAIDGMVIKDAASCKFFKKDMFGDKFDKAGVDVKCEVKDEGGKQVLSYEAPDPFNKGQMAQSKVNIVGTALLDDQMMDNKAEKAQ